MAIALATAWVAVVAMGTVPAFGATAQPTPLTLTPGSATFGDVDAGAASEQTITATNPAPEQAGVEVCGNQIDDDQDGAVDERSDCVSDGIDVAGGCCADKSLLLSLVEISTVQLTGSDAFAEAEDNCEGVALAPGESCDVRVTFMPTAAGEYAASLEFATSAGTVTAALTGVGVSSDPTTTTSEATTPTSASPTTATSPPTSQAPPTTPTSVGTAPSAGAPESSPPSTAPVADHAERGPWWPVAAALTLLVAVALAARVWARRGPNWVRAHVRAVARPGVDHDAAIARSPAGRSSPTCVVRLEPHTGRATQALLEVDR